MKIRKSRAGPRRITCESFGEWDSDLPSLFRRPPLSICIVPGWKKITIHKDLDCCNQHLEKISSEVLSWCAPPRKCWESESPRLPDGFQVAISIRWQPGQLGYGRLMATKEFVTHLISFGLESSDWSTKQCWDIRKSTNLLKLECERIRSQRARFCPGNLGGIPSMWTWAGRRKKGNQEI